jgi:hypothetical protein
LSEEALMQYGIPLLTLAVGWIARHYNLGPTGPLAPPAAPAAPPAPALTTDQRLANLEHQLAALIAALAKPATPPVPAA